MPAQRLSDETKEAILADYFGGALVTELAERYGIDPTYPSRLARRSGLEPRGLSERGMAWRKGPRGHYKKKPHIEERNRRVLADIASGKSVAYVAKAFGLTASCVYQIVKRAA